MWIIVIIILVTAFVLFCGSRNDTSSTSASSAATKPKASGSNLQPPACHGRTFDPTDMYDICYGLGCLAASIGHSNVYVFMSNVDETSSKEASVTIMARLDTSPTGYYKTNALNTLEEMELFFMPRDIANFLISIPFEVKNSGKTVLTIKPKGYGKYPASASVCDLLMEELENGYRASVVSKMSKTRYEVSANNLHNTVELTVH